MINRRVNKKPLTDDFEDDRQMDLDEVMKAFGGQLPIELQKQYGNRNTNTENRD
jgi:cell fate (sporulation/competence/biofilm development) regulator YmcA (YheA/YmcA/DUF963 family)